MNMKNIIIFILGFIVGIVGSFVLNNMQNNNNPIKDNNPIPSVTDAQKNYEIKVVEGELTGFEDSFTVEIVTSEGPFFYTIYDENIINQLEDLIEQKIKVEVKYNNNTKVGIITKIL